MQQYDLVTNREKACKEVKYIVNEKVIRGEKVTAQKQHCLLVKTQNNYLPVLTKC